MQATNNSKIEQQILSNELKEDKELKLSNDDNSKNDSFENIIRNSIQAITNGDKELKCHELKKSISLPTDYVFASLAERVYDEDPDKSKELHGKVVDPRIGNWQLLTVASHKGMTKGYIGAAYWNPDTQQVIIAHRGTDPKNIGALYTDIMGVLANEHTAQIDTAITFTHKIIGVLKEINKDKGLNIQLFFTGHSLGGWLAQITTFAAKHTVMQDGFCIATEHNNYHTQAVVFDSPGCRPMLERIQDSLVNRSSASLIDSLDITSYLSAPNLINACNPSVGDKYRVFIDISEEDRKKNLGLKYDLFMHQMTKIREVFDPKTDSVLKDKDGKLKAKKILDWPVLLSEKKDTKLLELLANKTVLFTLILWNPPVGGLLWGTTHAFKSTLQYAVRNGYISKVIKLNYESKQELNDFFKVANKENDFHFDDTAKVDKRNVFKKNYDLIYQKFAEFFRLSNKSNNFNEDKIDASSHRTVRYRVENLDEGYKNKRKLNVFTESECQFLERYKLLEKYKDLPGTLKLIKLFDVLGEKELQSKAIRLLSECKIEGEYIYSNNLAEFVPYIKRMLHFFEEMKTEVENACHNFSAEVLRGIYQSASFSYLKSLDKALDLKSNAFGLETFFIHNNLKILHLIQNNTSLGVLNVYKSTIEESEYYKEECHVFLNLDRVCYLGSAVFFRFLSKINYKYLVVLECGDDLNDKTREFFKELFKTVKKNQNIKVILVSKKDRALSNFIRTCNETNISYDTRDEIELKLNDLTADSRSKLLEKKLVFQGQEIPLSAIINDNEDLSSILDSEIITELFENKKIEIGKPLSKLGQTEDFYIDRNLVKKVKVKKEILRDDSLTDLFVISNTSKEELLNLTNGQRVRDFTEEDADRSNPVRFITLNAEESNFKNLCDIYSNYTIHWLKKDDGENLIWHKSHGKTLFGLRRYIENYESDLPENEYSENNTSIKIVDVDDIGKFDEKFIVIAAEPGMGKTTALTRLETQKKDNTKWFVRINLVEYKDELEQKKFREEDSIVEFLRENNIVSNKLAEKLLKSRLNNSGNIVFLLDGFDEITSQGQKNVINLLKELQKTKVEKVLISTRLHLKNELENVLSTVAYIFKPFFKIDQKQFLKKFWQVNNQNLDDYIQKLLKFIPESIGDKERKFMGIPLQMKMVAEAFQDSLENPIVLIQPFPENFNLLKLYDRFVSTKYRIYAKKIGVNTEFNNVQSAWFSEKLNKIHMRLAIRVLLPEMEKDFVGSKFPSEEEEKEMNLVGIVQFINDEIAFAHRTFGEYFVASFLAKVLYNERSYKYEAVLKFLAEQLFETKNEVIKTFLDYHLVQHASILKGNLNDMNKILSEDNADINITDVLGRSALHYAAQEGHDDIVNLLLNNRVIRDTDRLGKIALHYAARYNSTTQVIDYLLENSSNDINAKDNNGCTPLYYAAEHGNWNVVDFLIKKGADTRVLDQKSLIFHYIYQNNLKLVKTLIEQGVNVIAQDNRGNTLLHIASQRGYSTIVDFLLEKGADVEIANNSGKRPIIYAAENKNWNIVESLLRKNADFNDLSDEQKLLLLDHSIQNAHWDIVRLFMESNGRDNYFNRLSEQQKVELLCYLISTKDLNTTEFLIEKGTKINGYDSKNKEPIYYAAKNESWSIAELLLKRGANLNNLQNNRKKFSLLKYSAENFHWDVVTIFMKFRNNSWKSIDLLSNITELSTDRGKYFDQLTDRQKLDFLQYVISTGDLDITKFCIEKLIEKGKISDVDIPNQYGKTFLHLAAQDGQLNIIQYLVDEKGADLRTTGSAAILAAMKNNKLNIVKFLVERLAALDDMTPLHAAVKYGNKEVVEQFVENNLNAQNKTGNTPLHLAVIENKLNVVKFLIENGANIYITNKNEQTPISLSRSEGHREIGEFLLELNSKYEELFDSIRKGDLSKIECLIKGGADVNYQNDYGWNSLHLAASSGHLQIVKYLVGKGANLEATNALGNIPLHEAVKGNKLDIVKYFIEERGISANFINKIDHWMPIHFAVRYGELDMVKYLLGKGASLDAKQIHGLLPMHLSAFQDKLDIVKYLIEQGANVVATNATGKTPKDIAIIKNNTNILEFLEQAEQKKLLDAVKQGDFNKVIKLVEQGVNVNARDNNGQTSLHWAAKNGNLKIASFLVAKKADIYAEDSDCRKPIHLADHFGHKDIIELLKSRMDIDHEADVAKKLYINGKYNKALQAYKLLFSLQNNILGPKHFKTLITHMNLGIVYSKLGQNGKALEILTEVLKVQKDLGYNLTDILKTQHHIAEVHYKNGRYKDALKIYEEVFKEKKKILGLNHSDTLITMHHIGRVFNNQGKHSCALALFNEAFEKQCNLLETDHPDTLKTQHNIAFTLYRLDRNAEALLKLESFFEKSEKVLGPNHPDHLTTRHVKALLFKELGKYEEALENLKDIYKIQEEILGPDHSDTLATRHDIASVLYSQGKVEEALKIFREVYEKRKEVLGSCHLYTSYTYNFIKSIESKCSIQNYKKQQEVLLYLSEFVSSHASHVKIQSVNQGLYLSSFEARNIEMNGKCVAITRGLSQILFLQSGLYKSFLSNLKTSSEIYERLAQGKQISKREEKEVFTLSKLLNSFEEQLDSSTSSLPSNLTHIKSYKTLGELSDYISVIKDDFSIHLVTSNHVVAIYKTGDNYAYFDSNAAFISELKSVDQLMVVVEKGIQSANYEIEEKGLLVEHFDVAKANNLLSCADEEVLTREIKTERQLLADQDKEFGLIKINDHEVSRVQLYDFGTKVNIEGCTSLLINADMKLDSKKVLEYLSARKISMTARECFDSFKNSNENMKEAIQATKFIPLVGSKSEIENTEKIRELKRSSLDLAKKMIYYILSVGNIKSQPTGTVENKPAAYLDKVKVDNNQLEKSLYSF